jgi:glycosyltransferase involved in cell wall biosynthesis
MKRILIDGRFIGVGDSMTRYCLGFLKCVLDLDKENKYTLLIRPEGESTIQKSKIKNQNDNLKIKILDIAHYSLGEQTKLHNYLNKEKFDLVHFIQFNHPILYRGRYVVTIHDLTLFGHLHREKLHKKLAFNAVMKSAVKNSAKIVTISETSKRDIIENYGVDPKKIAVTYLAVDEKYSDGVKNKELRIKQFKEKYGITGDYILYTGMWKKHKNIVRMLQAFEQYLTEKQKNKRTKEDQGAITSEAKQSIQLVLVGKVDKNEPEVIDLVNQINNRMSNVQYPISNEIPNDQRGNESGKMHNTSCISHNTNRPLPIITTGFVEEEELPIAYAGAIFYVIPSLSEGFGLPPLEAMACGAPVISSKISAMPEILGDAALYFDPYSIEDIADKMKQMAENNELRQHFAHKGLEQASKYSWDNTAKGTLVVYRELFGD